MKVYGIYSVFPIYQIGILQSAQAFPGEFQVKAFSGNYGNFTILGKKSQEPRGLSFCRLSNFIPV